MATYATDAQGNMIYRMTDLTMPVQLVQEGDLVFDIPVRHSEPHSDYIWCLDANTEDEQAGIRLLMTINMPVTVKRAVPLKENQCIECGREGVKYAARRQCNACYQREHRAARRASLRKPEQLRLIV